MTRALVMIRRSHAAVVAVALAVQPAAAGSRPAKPSPTKPSPKPHDPRQDELSKLDRTYIELNSKRAYVAALPIARRALALQVELTGRNSREAVNHFNRVSTTLMMMGDFRGALAVDQQTLAASEATYGRESREVYYALTRLASIYSRWRDHDADGDAASQRALALVGKLDGEHSEAYARELERYGGLLSNRHQYAQSLQLLEQGLQIREALGKPARELIQPLDLLAAIYWQSHQRARSVATYERARAIAEQPNTSFSDRSLMLSSAINQYLYGGAPDLARPLVDTAVALYAAEIARLEHEQPDSYTIPALASQLGQIDQLSGDLVGAERAFEKVNAFDEAHGRIPLGITQLADVERKLGKYAEALAMIERVQAMMNKQTPGSGVAWSYNIIQLACELHDYARANRALADYRAYTVHFTGHDTEADALFELLSAWVAIVSGHTAAAEQRLTNSFEITERGLQAELATGSDLDHEASVSRHSFELDLAINFQLMYARRSSSAARLALTTVLRKKGRALDAAASSLTAIRAQLSPPDQQLLDELASARAQLAALTVAGPDATGPDFARQVAVYDDQIRKLELQLGKLSTAYRAASQPISLAAIQRAIPRGARLVEIVNYQPGDPKAPFIGQQTPSPRSYAGYVVATTGDPVLVELGPAPAIDDAVEAFRKAAANPDDDRVGELGHALYAMTMAKLAPALVGATNVLLAPDGALNVVPFAALVDDRGDYLVKRYTFTYLTSGRDLLRHGITAKPRTGGVIFADPAFDAASPDGTVVASARGSRSVDLAGQNWQSLPGTGQEADEVARHLRGATVYRGPDATETALKGVHGPKILHLATHGFFLPDEPAAATADPAPAAASLADARENPLLRSGLVLAGANQLHSGNDDGILTALEAAGLDLWGTQLVVLSACETGVGKVTNGDGVYGLRRALVIAGAQSLMMSLWQVDDAATRDLMAGYYARLTAGASRSSALRDIQLEMQRTPKYAHPYYWASFLSAGANTPLQN